MLAPETTILFRKEWRQLLRSKGAMLSALLLPTLLLLVIPGTQILGPSAAEGVNLPTGVNLPPGLETLSQDPKAMGRFMLPLFVTLAGLIVPMMGASYMVITEREAKTLELLVALPVSIQQILTAKFLALVVIASMVTLPLLGVDGGLLYATGQGSALFAVALVALLVASITLSVCGAFLISLLAKDFRTANNLNGIIVVPVLMVTLGLTALTPGPTWTALILAGLEALGAAGVLFIALRVVTFERLLR